MGSLNNQPSGVGLWLVRHGQTDWNLEGRYQGQADPPLNATGEAEAVRAGLFFADRRLDAIFSSDLFRARQTAAAIARQTGLDVQVDPRLREVNLGEWEGVLFSEIVARFPGLVESRQRAPLEFRAPGGESLREVAQRIWQAADAIAARYAGQEVAVISHGLALAALLTHAHGTDLGAAYEQIPPNAAPQRVTWPAGLTAPDELAAPPPRRDAHA